MIISVINHTLGFLSDAEVQTAIRAINRQIAEDFAPHWGMTATLKLEGHAGLPMTSDRQDMQRAVDMRGDGVIYLWHPIDTRSGLGYHARNFLGIPYGFIYPAIAEELRETWTVSLSHEALEMIIDPNVNLLVMGPHPADRSHTVVFWYEACDAVQGQDYDIEGIPVSNFVLPHYFTTSEEPGGRNDFLNVAPGGVPLKSFGVSPGGYSGFFDPLSGRHQTFAIEGDDFARRRLQVKQGLGLARRGQRYQNQMTTGLSESAAFRPFPGL